MNSAGPVLPAAPRFVAGAGLLLWGWQNGFLLYAAAMAVAIEGARWIRWRWPVTDKEFNNVSDLSSVILLVLVIYVFSTAGSKGIFTILSLLPFVFFLLVVIQAYSDSGGVRLSALFISLRRLDAAKHPEAGTRIDLTLPFVITCLISASAGNQRDLWFFAMVCLLLGIVLWDLRPRRYRARTWCALLVIAFTTAYVGQIGLTYVQTYIEGYAIQIFDRFMWRYRDPNMATTAIGSIGRIKLSDRIVLRVKTGKPLESPLLLREATYDTYGYGIWSNQAYDFTLVDPDISGTSWKLMDGAGGELVSISTYMPEVAGVIAVPHGVNGIRDVTATQITRNRYGSIKMEIKEGWTRYTVDYTAGPPPDAPPAARDLYVSDSYRDTFEDLVRQLELPGKDPARIIQAVRNYFADGFSYSLTQRHRYPRGRYLAEFLFNTRSGHCEFFATSTVLLLRAAGVPARYAVGYAIDEYSPLEGQYVARARHSHSWALAHVNGSWRVVDTTPSVWSPLEREGASGLEPLFDLWAWASFRFARWQSGDELEEESGNTGLLWLLVPLLGILLWRLYIKERVARGGRPAQPLRSRAHPGLDSSLYRLIAELERLGFRRRPGQTLGAWFNRLQDQVQLGPWREALAIHNRCRFDPAGISAADRGRLARHVDAALHGFAAAASSVGPASRHKGRRHA